MLVGVVESLCQLVRETKGVGHRNRSSRAPLAKRLAVNELHDKGADVLVLFDPVHRGDVLVGERRKQLGFALKARRTFAVGYGLFGKDFDRDIPLQSRVASSLHFPHPARTEWGGHFVGAEACA